MKVIAVTSQKGGTVGYGPKHLPKYLGKYEFRFNLRKQPHLIFDILSATFAKP